MPIGIVAVLYALWALPSDAPEPSESFDFVGMLLMSPGLALFLYGISSIPGEGTVISRKVLVPLCIGLVMLVTFVFYSFRPEHPLLDLRLFRNRRLSVATITMFLFAAAFFGGLLLVPTYFQQVRGLDTLHAAFLMVPQGLGAMVTMPIAGALSDRIPVGRIVPFGLLLITGGMFALTQVGTDTPYWGFMIPVLFVMGLGMGGTMMPLMTSALKTLQSHQVARGSTLLNITQQIASSVGVAVISVVFTNYLSASAAGGSGHRGAARPGARRRRRRSGRGPAGPGRSGRRLRQHLPRRRDPARPDVDPGRLPAAQARAVALPRRPARGGAGHRPLRPDGSSRDVALSGQGGWFR